MRARGSGSVFKRKGSPFWWLNYYRQGQPVREVARHVRTKAKLPATELNLPEAEKFLKHRVAQVTAEAFGGPAFLSPAEQKTTVGELLNSLARDFKLRGKLDPAVN